MVSEAVYISRKDHLYFMDEKAKVITAHTTWKKLLPELVEDCEQLLPNSLMFQQDCTPVYMTHITEDWLKSNGSGFITKDKWIITFVGCGTILESYDKLQPKPKQFLS